MAILEEYPVSFTFTSANSEMTFLGTLEFNVKTKKYMVYGVGCKNKSNLVESEKDLKKMIKECGEDDNWTGEIIGYELKPLYRVKKKVVIEKLK
jgi:hypothetical protein